VFTFQTRHKFVLPWLTCLDWGPQFCFPWAKERAGEQFNHVKLTIFYCLNCLCFVYGLLMRPQVCWSFLYFSEGFCDTDSDWHISVLVTFWEPISSEKPQKTSYSC